LIRDEPDWYQHRLLKPADRSVNLHIFSGGCPEIGRMLAFRDRVRENEADRELYERTKRELAAREWAYVQDYADAKAAVVEEIVSRAKSEPQPLMDFEDLVRRIRQTSAPPGVATKIVAVDGHGGAGKTTLAARLANALGCEVIQTDDFASWDNPV